MKDELVLVFPRCLLDEIGVFQGINQGVEPYIGKILDKGNTRFLKRSLAEEDPAFKQVIPYVMIRKDGRYLHYVRGKGSGEKRLVAMGSIGIGGHINSSDESLFHTGREYLRSGCSARTA